MRRQATVLTQVSQVLRTPPSEIRRGRDPRPRDLNIGEPARSKTISPAGLKDLSTVRGWNQGTRERSRKSRDSPTESRASQSRKAANMISPERCNETGKVAELASMDNPPAHAGRPSSIWSGRTNMSPGPLKDKSLASKMSILSATGNDNAYTRGAAEAEWASMASPPARAGSPSSIRSGGTPISLGPPKDIDLASKMSILLATGNDNGYARGAAEIASNQNAMVYLWDKQGWDGHSTWHKKLLGPMSCQPIDPNPFYRPPTHAYEPNEAYAWCERGQLFSKNRGLERGHCYGPNPINDNDDPRQVRKMSLAGWILISWMIWIILMLSFSQLSN